MYIHGGEGENIRSREIVGIFDMDSATVSPTTKQYLTNCEKQGKIKVITGDLPKSFVVTEQKGRQTVYFSKLSPQTLCGRGEKQKTAGI